jgi:23S rRNA (pseudouridine1915-N3)-methyltransferase
MSIRIVSLGRVKESFVLEGEGEYLKRLKKYCKVELLELDAPKSSALSEDELKDREASLFLSKMKRDEFLIVLDERGKQLASPELSKLMQERFLGGQPDICFAIGGAYGWHDSVRTRANFLWSLSKLTFTYQMTRLILTEQIYRAFTIIKGEPYHK